MWKVVSGAIPVVDNVKSRGLRVDSKCQCCGLEVESTNHVLFNCTVARQTWALSNFLIPENGFDDSHALYHNLFFLSLTAKNSLVPLEIRRSFPSILFFFEGRRFVILDIVAKIKDDANQWFFAQILENRELLGKQSAHASVTTKWSPPPHDWLKYNIVLSWAALHDIGGAAWVLRDEKGEILVHGRRSFASVTSKLDASVLCWQWAIESMKSLIINKIILAADDFDLIGVVLRPPA
ncbi:putative reverse transcriptase zinc-binding domain-containing protein [Arabidopsis thaliana]